MTAKEIIKQIECAKHTINAKPFLNKWGWYQNTLNIRAKKQTGKKLIIICSNEFFAFAWDDFDLSQNEKEELIGTISDLFFYHAENSTDLTDFSKGDPLEFVIKIYL